MSRWGGAFGRRRGGRPSPSPSPSTGRERAVEKPRGETDEAAVAEAVLVEDYEGLLLLRSPSDDTLSPSDITDLARGQSSDDGTVTVVAGAESAAADTFWPRLSELLDSLSDAGTESVRLVMAGAGHDRKDRPATARRIADAWGLKVQAPDGPPLLVPGGSLFVPTVPVGPGAEGGWWRFAPGARPEPQGPRSPAPPWQTALNGVPASTDGGSVVEQIPAGLLVRPAEATAARPGDLYHSVPVDPRRLAVVVGVPYGEDVAAEEVADVLAALPEPARSAARLVPGGRRDLLPLAQSVSDRLDVEVELMTGLPLIAAGRPLGTYPVRSVLVGADGTPQWLPFVDAVLCRPARGAEHPPAPRLLRWTSPLPGSSRPEEGVVGLSDEWQVSVTRAGLWVGPLGDPRLSYSARQVSAAGPLIEVGVPGERLDASLWPALSGLLGALAPDIRGRATLHVHGVPLDGGGELRRLAARHGLRTIRFAPPAPPNRTAARPVAPGPGESEGSGTTAEAGAPGESLPRGAASASPAGRPPVRSASASAPPSPPRSGTSTSSTAATSSAPAPVPETGANTGRKGRERVPLADLLSETDPSPDPDPDPDPAPASAPDPDPDPAPVPGRRSVPDSEPVPVPTTDRAPHRGSTERQGAPEDPAAPSPSPRTLPDTASAASPDQASDPASAPGAEELPDAPLPPVPFGPGHRSTEAERRGFRALADTEWDRHGAAVARSLARMPALRGKEQEAARADLIALRLYLHSAEGPLSHPAVTRALRSHEEGMFPYAACLVSALNRLPSYRGVVLRGTGPAPDVRVPRPGALLRDPALVSATPLDPTRPAMTAGASYVVWSVAARRVRQLLDTGDGPEEVVFAPGTLFRVLDVRRHDSSVQVFLRELIPHLPLEPDPDADRAALARLDEAVRGRSAPAGADQWPERCTGPVGTGPD